MGRLTAVITNSGLALRRLTVVGRRAVPTGEATLSRPTDLPETVALLNSTAFSSATTQLAAQLGRDTAPVRAEAAGYVREMAATHHPSVVRAWHRIAAWLVRGYDIITNEEELAELRKLDRKHTLIFLVSHRSYLDEFALPPSLVKAGISPCFGMAGANLDFFPLGTLARRNGIVHVRRASGDMPVYRLALRAMVGRMVADGNNLVWSIEGGRTRTGKLRPPRYGLLRYVIDAVDSVCAEDALIVPVSIMYDQLPLHEVELMASESRGSHKQPENLRWLVGYARGLENRLGRIYLDFGTPVPVYERLLALRAEGLDDRQVVERIALDTCHRINRTTPVSATAAVCVALLGADRGLTLCEVCATVAPLADYLSVRGWPVAGATDLTDRATVARTLQDLVRSGVLTRYDGGPDTVWAIGDNQHLIAAVYRNSAVHVLLVRAITELALLAIIRTPNGDIRTAWQEALALRELLKFDFFFAGRAEFAEELWDEVAIMAGSKDRPAAVSRSDATAWLADSAPLVAHLVLRPYIDAYRVVAEGLVSLDVDDAFDEGHFLDSCLRLAGQWQLQRRIASAESVSREMFGTALKMARHRGLVPDDPGGTDIAPRRRELVGQLDLMQRSIEILAAGISPPVQPDSYAGNGAANSALA
ncbi:lysophospholipid acyltransferase [Nocardia sp. NBC_00565]|uniref:lysophospholipid acyltransferase n=1 Tax=Nocardia sp. NBC_00565 TaxID=2975993 RepID=UPI002E7FB436|nr:lysophospholipid acyltransferase [Nocardia sp. NBC_00565]WUC06674.1 lysophospholipid acyltransferase [Nocardia sp. NBC_00565]